MNATEATIHDFTHGKHIRAAIIRANGDVETFRCGRSAPGDTKIYNGDTVLACGMSDYPYLVHAAKFDGVDFISVNYKRWSEPLFDEILLEWQ